MKKIGMGIAIILFGILLECSWPGNFAYITSGIGVVGLVVAIAGCVGKAEQ